MQGAEHRGNARSHQERSDWVLAGGKTFTAYLVQGITSF